jgi:hypothetical protein
VNSGPGRRLLRDVNPQAHNPSVSPAIIYQIECFTYCAVSTWTSLQCFAHCAVSTSTPFSVSLTVLYPPQLVSVFHLLCCINFNFPSVFRSLCCIYLNFFQCFAHCAVSTSTSFSVSLTVLYQLQFPVKRLSALLHSQLFTSVPAQKLALERHEMKIFSFSVLSCVYYINYLRGFRWTLYLPEYNVISNTKWYIS